VTTASLINPTPDEKVDQPIAVSGGRTRTPSAESAVATSAKADVAQTDRLAQLADAVRQHHSRVIGCAHQTFEHARHAGVALNEAKDQMPHGAWKIWVRENCDVSVRTAQKYMQIANNWNELQTKAPSTALLTIDTAVNLLKKPAGGPRDNTKNTHDRHPIARDGRTADDLDGDPSSANDEEDDREDRRHEDLHLDRGELGEPDHEETDDDGVQSASTEDILSDTATGYLRVCFGNSEFLPAPVLEEITPEHAKRAWIYETTLPKEQARRREQIEHDSVSADDAVRAGKQIIIASFWAMVWVGLMEAVGIDENTKFRLSESAYQPWTLPD
jgi:hypothetical protein